LLLPSIRDIHSPFAVFTSQESFSLVEDRCIPSPPPLTLPIRASEDPMGCPVSVLKVSLHLGIPPFPGWTAFAPLRLPRRDLTSDHSLPSTLDKTPFPLSKNSSTSCSEPNKVVVEGSPEEFVPGKVPSLLLRRKILQEVIKSSMFSRLLKSLFESVLPLPLQSSPSLLFSSRLFRFFPLPLKSSGGLSETFLNSSALVERFCLS